MGSTELICWKDHHQTLVAIFKSLLYQNQLVDCTIAAEGQYLKAHKLVLSSSSAYFQVLFAQEKEKNPIVILKDVKFQELKALIEFMYCGEVKIPEYRLKSFLDFAESLHIRGLSGARDKLYDSQQFHETNATVPRDKNSETHQQRNVHSNSYEEHACELAQVTCPCIEGQSTETSYQGEGSHLGVTNSSPIIQSSHTTSLRYKECPEGIETPSSNFEAVGVTNCSPIVQSSHTTSLRYKECAEGMETHSSNFEAECLHIVQDRFVPEDNFLSNGEDPLGMDCVVIKEETTFLHLEPKVKGVDDAMNSKMVEDISVTECDIIEKDAVSVPYEVKEENEYADIDISYDEISCPSPTRISMDPELPAQQSDVQGAPPLTDGAAHRDAAARPGHGINPAVHEARLHCGEGDQVAQEEHEEEPLVITQAVGEKRHDCPQCSKSFPTLALLRRHVRVQHSAGHLHSCNKCTKTFCDSTTLKVHMTTHTGDRSYQCGVCKACFRFRDNLTTHMREHTGERPFVCKLCKACFTRRGLLSVHMRKHTGEKPFKCAVCKTRFSRKCNLSKHMLKHAGQRDHSSAMCLEFISPKGGVSLGTNTSTRLSGLRRARSGTFLPGCTVPYN